ncbi:unnamed protein product [Gadus morhua 'NCC']
MPMLPGAHKPPPRLSLLIPHISAERKATPVQTTSSLTCSIRLTGNDSVCASPNVVFYKLTTTLVPLKTLRLKT